MNKASQVAYIQARYDVYQRNDGRMVYYTMKGINERFGRPLSETVAKWEIYKYLEDWYKNN